MHRYLQRRGMTVVARNLQLPPLKAELDIVAVEGSTYVFVEVKTRESDSFGKPEEAVDLEKRTQITRAARAYLRAAGATWDQARFDIVSVTTGGDVRLEHIKDAFRLVRPL
ncbi:MAG TPA: YraN family protein [Bryobacteraceae bacterium]|nr:YraN family protein [Bryobacteraceae bacterium]